MIYVLYQADKFWKKIKRKPHCLTYTGLELKIFMLLTPKCWADRHMPLCPPWFLYYKIYTLKHLFSSNTTLGMSGLIWNLEFGEF